MPTSHQFESVITHINTSNRTEMLVVDYCYYFVADKRIHEEIKVFSPFESDLVCTDSTHDLDVLATAE